MRLLFYLYCLPLLLPSNFALCLPQPKTPAARRRGALRQLQLSTITTTEPLFATSDCHVHVGNLDWNLSVNAVSEQLEEALREIDADKITVKPVNAGKARDRTKCHGGSAVIQFATPEQATAGLRSLQSYSEDHDKGFRLKHAVQKQLPVVEDTREPLTAERRRFRQDRAERYARQRLHVAERTDRIIARLTNSLQSISVLQAEALDWTTCPPEIDPLRGGGLVEGSSRGARKRAGVEAFCGVVQALGNNSANDNKHLTIADLGCGTGNLALPLHWWLHRTVQRGEYHTVAVDRNGKSLKRLTERADGAKVPVRVLQEDLLNLVSSNTLLECGMVVSLHACGAASDMAMAAAVARSAPFAISPCCIGKINKKPTKGMPPLQDFSYPRSSWLQQAVTKDEYVLLAKAADYGVIYDTKDKGELQRRQRCRMAKRIVETDRLQWAAQHGYQVRMVELPRIGPLYPKRELLLGAPKGSDAAAKIMALETTASVE